MGISKPSIQNFFKDYLNPKILCEYIKNCWNDYKNKYQIKHDLIITTTNVIDIDFKPKITDYLNKDELMKLICIFEKAFFNLLKDRSSYIGIIDDESLFINISTPSDALYQLIDIKNLKKAEKFRDNLKSMKITSTKDPDPVEIEEGTWSLNGQILKGLLL